MGALSKFGKKVAEHLPEILTVGAVGCVASGEYLLWKATKKETEDGNKKHYIAPLVITGAGVGCIIASNRVSNAQKVSLAAVASALAATNQKQRQVLEKKCTPEELAEIDKLNEFSEGKESGRKLYYLPLYGIKFWSTPELVERAEWQADKFLQGDGQVGLDDILEFLHAYTNVPENEWAARGVKWTFDWDSDEEQHIVFEETPKTLMGVDCVELKIHQTGTTRPHDYY